MLGVLGLLFAGASWKLGYFAGGQPGPGLLPAAAGAMLLPLALLLARAPLEPEDERTLGGRPLAGLGLLAAYCLAMPWAGMVLPTFVAGALWMRLLHGRPTVSSVFWSALLCATFIGGFIFLLKVPMPLWPEFQ